MLLYMHHIQYDCTMFCLTYIIIGILLEPDVFISLKSVTLGVGILCLKCEAIAFNEGNPTISFQYTIDDFSFAKQIFCLINTSLLEVGTSCTY